MTDRAGQQIGPYLVLERIAQGGQGALFKARHRDLGREVALKVLLDPDPKHVRRFVQEARVLANLDHPNLPVVYEVGEAGRVPFIAMELVKGETLREIVERGGLPDRDWIRRVLVPIARVLHHCHQQGIVHRDLKPANILLERGSGRPVLVDFGLIRKVGEDYTQLSQTGDTLGTPSYMAPEQADAEVGEVGPWTDVYGLGAVLYYLLTGKPPFAGSTKYNVILKVLRAAAPDPRDENAAVPADLARLCQGAMAKTPAVRPPDMEAFAAALESSSDEAELEPRTNLLLISLVAGGALLAGVAGWALRDTPGPAPSASTPAVPSAIADKTRPDPQPASKTAKPQPKVDVAALLRAGQDLLLAGHARAAIERLQRVLDADPSRWTAWQLSGEARWLLGQPEQALRDLDHAVEIARGRDPLVHATRAPVRHLNGDRQGARADMQRAEQIGNGLLSARPNHPTALLALGEVHRYHKRGAEAAAKYAAVLRLEPGLSVAYHRWGLLLRRSPREAERVYAKWAQAVPRSQGAWISLASAQLRRGLYQAGLRSLATAERLGPLSFMSLRLRGSCRWKLALKSKRIGEPDPELSRLAVADFSAALRARPSYGIARRERGLAYLALGKPDQAVADLVPALRYARKQGSARRIRQVQAALDQARARFWADPRRARHYAKATALEQKLRERAGKHTRAWRDRVDRLNKREEFLEAAAVADRALRARVRDYWTCVHGSYARKRLAEGARGALRRVHLQEAVQLLEAAAKIKPRTPRVHNDLGYVFELLGSWELAIRECDKWLELERGHWLPWARRGWAGYNLAKSLGGQGATSLRRALRDFEQGRRLLLGRGAEGDLAELDRRLWLVRRASQAAGR